MSAVSGGGWTPLEALEAIANFEPPIHELSKDQKNQLGACAACRRAREQKWPPSGLCEKHYGWLANLTAKNERERAVQYISMKEIARAALRRATGAATTDGENP